MLTEEIMNYKNTKGKGETLHKNSFKSSCRSGFTLTELLTAVRIVGILASVALPRYMRSVERARATEAMVAIKALNDSIYAYYAEKENCPQGFNRLVASLPSGSVKNFTITMNATTNVPGTDCPGVVATRTGGGGYSYTIWNPYTRGTTGKALALQCAPDSETDEKSKAVCESLGLYRSSEGGNEISVGPFKPVGPIEPIEGPVGPKTADPLPL